MTVLLTILAASAVAASSRAACHEAALKSLRKDADATAPFVLILATGDRYRVLGQDFIDPRDWRAGDRVEVCPEPPQTGLTSTARMSTIKNERLGEALVALDLNVSKPDY